MVQNLSDAKSTVIIIALVVWGSLVLCSRILEVSNLVLFIAIIFSFVFLIAIYKYLNKKQRLEYLRNKYKSEELVQNIYHRYFWVGQTSAQLLDSLGKPAAVDNMVMKTKVKDVWKYNKRGANRYALRITIENGFVVGWEKKS
ncbi:hypothetical protein ACET8U_06715 [Aeromonas veronii]